jgi:D-alanyl-D-alanine endopeptidase (penicillin-binding protein 7)
MPPAKKRNKLSVAVLLLALVGAGTLIPLAYQKGQQVRQESVAVAVRPAAPAAPAAPASPADGLPPAPAAPPPGDLAAPPRPGAEQVPEGESETDRSPNAASPGGPVLSFGRAQGLHKTPDPLRLNSSAALVVDRASGEVLVQKNAQVVLPIASLTKLMTSLVVLEARQPMDEVLTITEEDVDYQRNSRSRLKVGSTLTRQEALQLALMSSENRAAHALGRAYPGGLQNLVAAMNTRARQLGMRDAQFVDPTGLSNGNRATARDVALLVRAAGQHPLIAEYSTTRQHVADLGERSLQYINSNRLVRSEKAGWDISLQKTGYIVEAGRCLTMLTEVAGRDLIMVLLDAESNGTRMADAERLRRWAVAQWGGPDAVAALKAETAKPRKVASARKASSGGKKTTAVARKKTTGKATAVAQKKKDGKAATRTASGKKSEGRVRQSFATARSGDKS